MIQATFDTGLQGWTVLDGTIAYDPAEGGAALGAEGGSDAWEFVAPAEWLGDLSAYFGAQLSFQLRQSITTSQLNQTFPDVRLFGAGLELVADIGDNPGTDWTGYSVGLALGNGWKVGSLTGRIATEDEIRAVLGDLTGLHIRGEFVQGTTGDMTWLDNVILSDPEPMPPVPGGWRLTETFDTDIAGWSFVADVAEFQWRGDDGNPGGYLHAVDLGTGPTWYFVASDRFLGDRSAFFAGELSFDLRQSSLSSQFNDPDVVLEGGGVRLVLDTPENPGLDWTPYSVTLSAAAGWRVGTLGGEFATNNQIKAALADLELLHIRGEFVVGNDFGGLDNVALTARAARVYLLSDPGLQNLVQGYQQLAPALDAASDGQMIEVVSAGGLDVGPWNVSANRLTVASDAALNGTFRLEASARVFTLTGSNDADVAASTLRTRINGSDGDNLLRGNKAFDRILAGGGNDTVIGGNGADLLRGGDGRDVLRGDGGADNLIGEAGNDSLRGGSGNDRLNGGAGRDTLMGDGGHDTLIGGPGNDLLSGGKGNDLLTGGTGADVFVFGVGEGEDRIFDFNPALDRLRLDATLWGDSALTAAQVLVQFATVENGDSVLRFDGGEVLVLDNLAHPMVLEALIDLF